MLLPIGLFVAGLVVVVIGRFHVLFRDVSPAGNFLTTLSFWLRLGSLLLLGNALLLAAVIAFALQWR